MIYYFIVVKIDVTAVPQNVSQSSVLSLEFEYFLVNQGTSCQQDPLLFYISQQLVIFEE